MDGQVPNYSYLPGNELEQIGSGPAFDYDRNGNLLRTGDGSLELGYNAKDQTTTANGTEMTYTDADQTRRLTSGDTRFADILGRRLDL